MGVVVPQSATVEQRLREALRRGDLDGYLRALSDTHVLVFGSRRLADEGMDDPEAPLGLVRDMGGAMRVFAVTPNQIVDPGPYLVYHAMTLRSMLRRCRPLTWQLVVNQGTDHEGRIPVKKLAAWVDQHPDEIRPLADYGDRITALDSWERTGPLAAALACGAHLAVQNEVPWNSVGEVYNDYPADARLLDLLGEPPEPAGPADPAVVAAHMAAMRRDGVADPDARAAAPDVRAWYYGRAVNLARWGAATRLCDQDEARETVLRVGSLAAAQYRDWREFSTGYLLGRLLHFGDTERKQYYRPLRKVHRILCEDPASPWRTLNLADAAA